LLPLLSFSAEMTSVARGSPYPGTWIIGATPTPTAHIVMVRTPAKG
jgi:hypothetical protein